MKTFDTEMSKLRLSEELNTVWAAVTLGFMLWAAALLYLLPEMCRLVPWLVFHTSSLVIAVLLVYRIKLTISMYKLETQKVMQ